MIYPMGGTVDGTRGDHVLLAPPFIIDNGTIDAIVERLGDAIDAAIAAKSELRSSEMPHPGAMSAFGTK